MPLVAHNDLPTFRRLRERGQEVLTVEQARQQDIRELHIGLLNMMPDAALTATEQQFIGLVGSCRQLAQFHVYPFSIPELNRGARAKEHIGQYYFEFAALAERGLDALIITGANVASDNERGQEVLTVEQARQQDIRELHIGLLNMMPDAALTATEQQFIGLVGSCRQLAQFHVYPFSIPELNRGARAKEHIGQYYFEFAALAERGLDALIITGANVANPSLDQETFWDPLIEVARWAEDNVASILCSCLATHALVKHNHGIDRQPLPRKQWGVYSHRVNRPEHPLMRGINARFDAPHSRYNAVTRSQLEQAGLAVLVESGEAGVHLAVSPDQFRTVYFQGHPEYDASSLLKEYKREVFRYLDGELESAPPYPENYFSAQAIEIAGRFLDGLS